MQDFMGHGIDSSEIEQAGIVEGPDVVFGPTQPLTLVDVCGSLPSKSVADALLSSFLKSKFLHTRKYKRETLLTCSVYSQWKVSTRGMSWIEFIY